MRIFKVLSILLDYPRAEWLAHAGELKTAIATDTLLPAKLANRLAGFIDHLAQDDLLCIQEEYVALFDRGRGLSLHLFEHVHGESRDRGPAMVDLVGHYRARGFEISAAELPDYLPLFLEFLSLCEPEEAQETLSGAVQIVAALAARAKERRSAYAVVFEAIEALADARIDREMVRRAVEEDARRDDSLEALDKEWEDAPAFGNENPGACSVCPAARPALATGAAPVLRPGAAPVLRPGAAQN